MINKKNYKTILIINKIFKIIQIIKYLLINYKIL